MLQAKTQHKGDGATKVTNTGATWDLDSEPEDDFGIAISRQRGSVSAPSPHPRRSDRAAPALPQRNGEEEPAQASVGREKAPNGGSERKKRSVAAEPSARQRGSRVSSRTSDGTEGRSSRTKDRSRKLPAEAASEQRQPTPTDDGRKPSSVKAEAVGGGERRQRPERKGKSAETNLRLLDGPVVVTCRRERRIQATTSREGCFR